MDANLIGDTAINEYAIPQAQSIKSWQNAPFKDATYIKNINKNLTCTELPGYSCVNAAQGLCLEFLMLELEALTEDTATCRSLHANTNFHGDEFLSTKQNENYQNLTLQ